MKRIKFGILLIPLAVLLLVAPPVYADTANPDSTPTVLDFNVYRNSIESGDMLFIIYANVPYTTVPDTPFSETFIWRLYDTDNTTEFGSTVGNNYNEDGYGYNVFSMYFSASTVTSLGMVWGTPYPVRLSGNPSVFDTPPIYNYVISAGDYSILTDQAGVQSEIASRVLELAALLNSRWGLAPGASLLTQNETATVLSIYGEAFFRAAIFGLQAMAPTAFSVVIRVVDVAYRDWDPEYSVNVTNQWSGTWIETAQEAGGVLFGTEYDLLSVIMMLGMCGLLMIANIWITVDHWNGLIDCAVLGIIGARLSMFDLAFLILLAALCFIYISGKIWFGFIK